MSTRILIVDDSPYVADAFAKLISRCGYETQTAYSGREAAQQATQFRPHMVLMDICMPGQDGYETAKQIRSELGNAPVFLVAVTCLAQTQDRQRALESGFDLHVAKPVALSTLYGLLAILNRNRTTHAFVDQAGLAERKVNHVSCDCPTLSVSETPPLHLGERPTVAEIDNCLDSILASKLSEHDRRKAIEDLFRQYAAMLPQR